MFRRNQHRLSYLTKLLLLLAWHMILAAPQAVWADIYRFITIDGIETFTDSPTQQDAQIIIRDSGKAVRKSSRSARTLSKESKKVPAPSLKEIIEKTIEAQTEQQAIPTSSEIETILPVSGTITSGVGMRIDPIDGTWRHHNGIDIAVPTGSPVRAVANGIVVYSGLRSGYGWTVLIEHDNGMITLCGHNSRNTVEQGQQIRKGEVIALAGSTGRSTGPHVHFEAWQSGNNITAAFMPGSTTRIAAIPQSSRRAQFRKEVLADGSLLITNITSAIP